MINGIDWSENGLLAISGDVLSLYKSLDGLFYKWAHEEFQAKEYLFPTFINVQELEKISYFTSFPHLATFPTSLLLDDGNLKRFIERRPLSLQGEINLTKANPIREVLTPAACYHLYIHLQNMNFASTNYFTTINNCFRQETYYKPLQRQWNFHMREIVCFGSRETVEKFLENARKKLSEFCVAIGLSTEWEVATDPFFAPEHNPKYIAQIVAPTKMEMIFQGLSIGSTNLHRDYFGKSFNISLNGEHIHSACVAFGLERWIYAFIKQFGDCKEDWYDLDSLKI